MEATMAFISATPITTRATTNNASRTIHPTRRRRTHTHNGNITRLTATASPPEHHHENAANQSRPRRRDGSKVVAALAAIATTMITGMHPSAMRARGAYAVSSSSVGELTVARAEAESSRLSGRSNGKQLVNVKTAKERAQNHSNQDGHGMHGHGMHGHGTDGTPFAVAGTSALLASAVAVAVTHPIDTVKTMRQARASGRRTSKLSARVLYRGLGSNIAKEAPNAAVYLASYEMFKAWLLQIPVLASMPLLAMCFAGMLGDAVGSVVRVPAEIVNKRLQLGLNADWRSAVREAFLSASGVDSTRAAWIAVLWRDVPYGGLQIAGYELFRGIFARSGIAALATGLPLSIASGAVAGLAAAMITTPADVLVTRLSTQTPQCYLETRRYMSAVATGRRIVQDEGFGKLWTGAVARGLFYAPMIGLFFAVYESLKGALLHRAATKAAVIGGLLHAAQTAVSVGSAVVGGLHVPLRLAGLVLFSALLPGGGRRGQQSERRREGAERSPHG